MSFIEIRNLKYKYPHTERLALNNLNFTVEKGQFIGLVGENKAGKSTLCSALVGLVPSMFKGAYGGSMLVDGLDAGTTPVARMCQKVGLVFQNPFNQLSGAKDTVFEEVAFGLQNFGVPRDEMTARVNETLKLLDIDRYRDRNPFDLSGGQTQRVAIASILAMHPDVIVLDEPTSQLDPEGAEEVFRVVDTLAKTGITIVMAEHKMEKLAAYCDKILLLHDGSQIDYDTPERIFSRDDLVKYGVEPPVYTKVCQKMGVRNADGTYPVTLKQVEECREKFPERLEVSGAKDCGDSAEKVFCIEKLAFHYQSGTPIIKDLNLVLDARPTALIGQNGAGKTTLVKLLKGLLKPVWGTVSYMGEDIAGRTVAMMAGNVGYVFQNPDDQIFQNHVLDEVMVGPQNIGMSRDEAEKRALEALEFLGIGAFAMENPYDLELSERKMVAIASVVAMNTKVIILDEPTIAQDVKGRAMLGRLVKQLQAQGKSVLAILHDMDFVAEYFDRVIVMSGGNVLADGMGECVFAQTEILKEACLEQPHVMSFCRQMGYGDVYLRL